MKKLKCYLCTLTVQNSAGLPANCVTLAIASTPAQAIKIASAETKLPRGWSILSTAAIALRTEKLEEIAERVLGWRRP